jgi:uncharacterized membrane protein
LRNLLIHFRSIWEMPSENVFLCLETKTVTCRKKLLSSSSKKGLTIMRFSTQKIVKSSIWQNRIKGSCDYFVVAPYTIIPGCTKKTFALLFFIIIKATWLFSIKDNYARLYRLVHLTWWENILAVLTVNTYLIGLLSVEKFAIFMKQLSYPKDRNLG